MESSSPAGKRCSASPLRILFVANPFCRTEFALGHSGLNCTVKRVVSLGQARPLLETNLFDVLVAEDTIHSPIDLDELSELECEHPSVRFVALIDERMETT